MRASRRGVGAVLLLSVSAVVPLLAQGGRGAQAPDTLSVRKADSGYVFNYTNQKLEVVLEAVAAAGGIALTENRMPSVNISLNTNGVAVPQKDMINILRQEAASYNLTIRGDSAGSHYITIEGPQAAPPGPTPQQLAQQAIANATLSVHMYRLKYADASQLAPVLQSLFTGTGTPGGGAGAAGVGANAVGVTARGPGGAANGGVAVTGANAGGAGAGNTGFTVTRMVDASTGNTSVVTSGNIAGAPPGLQAAFAQLQAGGAGAPGGAGALSATSQLVRIVAEETSNSLLVRSTDADWKVILALLTGM